MNWLRARSDTWKANFYYIYICNIRARGKRILELWVMRCRIEFVNEIHHPFLWELQNASCICFYLSFTVKSVVNSNWQQLTIANTSSSDLERYFDRVAWPEANQKSHIVESQFALIVCADKSRAFFFRCHCGM